MDHISLLGHFTADHTFICTKHSNIGPDQTTITLLTATADVTNMKHTDMKNGAQLNINNSVL